MSTDYIFRASLSPDQQRQAADRLLQAVVSGHYDRSPNRLLPNHSPLITEDAEFWEAVNEAAYGHPFYVHCITGWLVIRAEKHVNINTFRSLAEAIERKHTVTSVVNSN